MATITGGKTYFIPIPGFDAILARSEVMHDEMEKVGTKMAAVAREKVPIGPTGDTHDSIQGGAVMEDGGWIARASAGTPYAPYVEFGTHDESPTPAQPFMRPALDEALR